MLHFYFLFLNIHGIVHLNAASFLLFFTISSCIFWKWKSQRTLVNQNVIFSHLKLVERMGTWSAFFVPVVLHYGMDACTIFFASSPTLLVIAAMLSLSFRCPCISRLKISLLFEDKKLKLKKRSANFLHAFLFLSSFIDVQEFVDDVVAVVVVIFTRRSSFILYALKKCWKFLSYSDFAHSSMCMHCWLQSNIWRIRLKRYSCIFLFLHHKQRRFSGGILMEFLYIHSFIRFIFLLFRHSLLCSEVCTWRSYESYSVRSSVCQPILYLCGIFIRMDRILIRRKIRHTGNKKKKKSFTLNA